MAVSGADIVEAARAEIGDPYVWGAEGPSAFDCSGLVQYVFGKFGIRTPRVTQDQVRFGVEVSKSKLQAGDLVFSSWDGKPHSHVGIYTGNGSIIVAPHTGAKVQEQRLSDNYWAHVDALRRVPGVSGGPPSVGDLEDLTNKATGALGNIGGGLTGGVNAAAGALRDIAKAGQNVGKLAELATHLFLPNNILRGVAGIAGGIFVLIGIWFISREARL